MSINRWKLHAEFKLFEFVKVAHQSQSQAAEASTMQKKTIEQIYQKKYKAVYNPYLKYSLLRPSSDSSGKFKKQFVIFIRSIFKNLKRLDRDIHFIVLTDHKSSYHVVKLLNKFVQKDVYDRLKVISDQCY